MLGRFALQMDNDDLQNVCIPDLGRLIKDNETVVSHWLVQTGGQAVALDETEAPLQVGRVRFSISRLNDELALREGYVEQQYQDFDCRNTVARLMEAMDVAAPAVYMGKPTLMLQGLAVKVGSQSIPYEWNGVIGLLGGERARSTYDYSIGNGGASRPHILGLNRG